MLTYMVILFTVKVHLQYMEERGSMHTVGPTGCLHEKEVNSGPNLTPSMKIALR